jgi:CheY-like chemotaxis protein
MISGFSTTSSSSLLKMIEFSAGFSKPFMYGMISLGILKGIDFSINITWRQRLHWLIAEDEVDIRNLVAMMAQMWGHTPITFETGQKTWDWLDEIESGQHDGPLPEFALMDIRMPGKRGDEIAHRIRQIPAIENIPVVLMTAFVLSDSERFDMINESGVDQIINKPLPDLQQLNQILHDIIKNRAGN